MFVDYTDEDDYVDVSNFGWVNFSDMRVPRLRGQFDFLN